MRDGLLAVDRIEEAESKNLEEICLLEKGVLFGVFDGREVLGEVKKKIEEKLSILRESRPRRA